MKTLKTLVLAAISLTTMNAIAQDQPKMDPQQKAQKETDNIERTLNGITADQVSKILTIEQDFEKNAQDVRTTNQGDNDAIKAKIYALRLDRNTQIKVILTSDQYTQYLQLEQDQETKRKSAQNRE